MSSASAATMEAQREAPARTYRERLVAAVDELEALVAAFDPSVVLGSQAQALVKLFNRGERVCGAGKALAAQRAAACNAHLGTRARSPEDWLAKETGTSVGDAR